MSKVIAYSCSLVPCELIAAAGLRYKRIMPKLSLIDVEGLTAGLCQYAGAFAAAVRESDCDAVIVTTLCDQMRRIAERIQIDCDKPVLLMNVPATQSSSASRQLYVDELLRLSRFLKDLSGQAVERHSLVDVMLKYDALRDALKQRGLAMPASQFVRSILAFPDGNQSTSDNETKLDSNAMPLAIVGGELLWEDLALLDYIESVGGRIVLNATDIGNRSLPGPFDRPSLETEPFSALAQAYFGTIPHAFHRPNSDLCCYLKSAFTEHGVRGIIFRRYQWCDTWNAELPILRELSHVPVLELDMGCEQGGLSRITSQIQAFMEMIR